MPHSYVVSLYHCVWSTKDRHPWLDESEVRERVWAGIGGVARENGMTALLVGGWRDHVHALLALKATTSVSEAMRTVKAKSSQFVKKSFPHLRGFAWQEGYGAFSIMTSAIETTKQYILSQEDHHRRKTFEEEFVAFLESNHVPYDVKFLWG